MVGGKDEEVHCGVHGPVIVWDPAFSSLAPTVLMLPPHAPVDPARRFRRHRWLQSQRPAAATCSTGQRTRAAWAVELQIQSTAKR